MVVNYVIKNMARNGARVTKQNEMNNHHHQHHDDDEKVNFTHKFYVNRETIALPCVCVCVFKLFLNGKL